MPSISSILGARIPLSLLFQDRRIAQWLWAHTRTASTCSSHPFSLRRARMMMEVELLLFSKLSEFFSHRKTLSRQSPKYSRVSLVFRGRGWVIRQPSHFLRIREDWPGCQSYVAARYDWVRARNLGCRQERERGSHHRFREPRFDRIHQGGCHRGTSSNAYFDSVTNFVHSTVTFRTLRQNVVMHAPIMLRPQSGYPSAFVIESDFKTRIRKSTLQRIRSKYLSFDHMLQHARLTLGLVYELAFAKL
jgi:hypothetical protein